MKELPRDPSSFRDPSGFVYRHPELGLLRQVQARYQPHYQQLIDSGLYQQLVSDALLVPHDELEDSAAAATAEAWRVLKPIELPVISYPYEWCFSAYRQAALLTLSIQRRALEHGMTLKDASVFNVQFRGVWPIFIDTLSFEIYEDGEPWVAYNQFCRHFLAPLALMAKVDVALNRLLAIHLDGIPLELAVKLLPSRCRLSPGCLMHIYLHARMVRKYSQTDGAEPRRPAARMSKSKLLAMLESLERLLRSLRYQPAGTQWADYYQATSYTHEAFTEKEACVRRMGDSIKPQVTWDLGANTGVFSQIASEFSETTVAWDMDPACVEKGFLALRKQRQTDVHPLLLDLTNPSGRVGWANAERMSLADRGPADLVMALALIHHLAIANNVPLADVASLLARLGRQLIIEFVPKSDPQVQRLLASRVDIFDQYTLSEFERAFGQHFHIEEKQAVDARHDDPRQGRVIYRMRQRRGESWDQRLDS